MKRERGNRAMLAGNLTELIRTEDLCALLRLCGVEEGALFHGSDYDFLLSVSKVLPLLEGHPFPQSLHRFLEEHFAITQRLTPDTTAEIWHTVADALLTRPREFPADLHSHTALSLSLPSLALQANAMLWRADGLVNTKAVTWQDWEGELQTALEQKMESGASHILLTLTNETARQIPDPFHVGKSLENTAKSDDDRALLSAQLIRFCCVAAAKQGLTLVLSVCANAENAVTFMERMDRMVGLPSLILIVNEENMQPILSFASRVHSHPVTLALDRSRYATDIAFERATSELARCYPLGRLSVLDGEYLKSFVWRS